MTSVASPTEALPYICEYQNGKATAKEKEKWERLFLLSQ